jgi:hypothetical protein
MKLLGNGLAHAMHLVTAARTGLLVVGKVIFHALARQVFRQRSAAALLARFAFDRWQSSIWKLGDIALFAVGVSLPAVSFNRNLFGFIEEAVNVLFTLRRKTMQPRKRQLFLQFDDAVSELTVLRLERGNARHQLLNSRFAGPIHQILESEPFGRVNRGVRELSARDLIVPHRMVDHRIDVDAVENPV